MRIGLAEIDGQHALVALRGSSMVRLDGLPVDPVSILVDSALRARAEAAIATAPEVDSTAVRLLPPLASFGKILCVGLNYADHAAESPYERPNFPVFFLRVDTGVIGPNDPIVRPQISDNLDFEAEMAIVIGKPGRRIPEASALDHVLAYTVFNDGSLRDWQFKGPQWTLGKNFDDTAPMGPFLVSSDEVPAGGKGLRITTSLNGKIVQDANTKDLLFSIQELIATASQAMTLNVGDLIVTGTPAGVGFARKPPLFMKAGDICEVELEGVGKLVNKIVDEVIE